jgi:hypothetical protein
VRIYGNIFDYAAVQRYRLSLDGLKSWWNAMLGWREWATANPSRAKRFSRMSLDWLLKHAIRCIDASTNAADGEPHERSYSMFWRFELAIRSYFKKHDRFPPPTSSVLQAYCKIARTHGLAGEFPLARIN